MGRSGVINVATIIMTHIRGLITPLIITTHEPPSKDPAIYGTILRFPILGISHFGSKGYWLLCLPSIRKSQRLSPHAPEP